MGDIRRAASHEVRLSESTGESEHIGDKKQMVVEMFAVTSQAAAVPGTSAPLLELTTLGEAAWSQPLSGF